jgi:hypothetical protein
MKITENVKKYAGESGIPEGAAVEERVGGKPREFREEDGELYAEPSEQRLVCDAL